MKSIIIINALEQIHKDVFTRMLIEALFVPKKTSQNNLNIYQEEPGSRIYNGDKTASSINGAGKTGQLHVKE